MISNQLAHELSYVALFFVVSILSILWLLVERRKEIHWHIYLPEKASLLEHCKRSVAAFFRVIRLFLVHGNLLPVLISADDIALSNGEEKNTDITEKTTKESNKDSPPKDDTQKESATTQSASSNDTIDSVTTGNKTEHTDTTHDDSSNEGKASDTGADDAQSDEIASSDQSNKVAAVTDKLTPTRAKQIAVQQQNAAMVMADAMSQIQKPMLLRYMAWVTVAFIAVFASFLFFPVSEKPPAIISYLGVCFVFFGGLLVSTLLLMVTELQLSNAFGNKTMGLNLNMRMSAYRDRIVTMLLLWVVILVNLAAVGYQNHSFDLILITVSQQNGQWHVLPHLLGVVSFLGAVMCLEVVLQSNDKPTPETTQTNASHALLPPVLFNHVTYLIAQYAVRILLLCLMLCGYFGGYDLVFMGQLPDLVCFVMKLTVMIVVYSWLQPRVTGLLQHKFSGSDTTQNILRMTWFVLLPIAIVNMALQLFVL